MKNKLIFKSSNNFTKYFLILFVGGIGSILVGGFLFLSQQSKEYPDLFALVLGSFFSLFGLLSFLFSFFFRTLYIYVDKFESRTFFDIFKNTINYEDINSWTETKKENKTEIWFDLTIYSNKTKFCISSLYYHDYQSIKAILTNGKKRNIKNEKTNEERIKLYFKIFILLFGLLIIYGVFYISKNRTEKIFIEETIRIEDVITNKPQIEKGSRGSRFVHIKLKKFPKFTFQLAGVNYSATYISDLVDKVKVGDTLYLDIKKDDYLKKLAKEKELGFWDKYSNYEFIYIVGLKDKNMEYLSVDDFNKENSSDAKYAIVFLLLSFTYLLYTYRKVNKKP